MNKTERHETFTRRLPIYRALADMPPLSHWPDRNCPFSWEASEVIRFIMTRGVDIEEAKRIFNRAHVHGQCANAFITFDAETKLWKGTGLSAITAGSADSNLLRDAEEDARQSGCASSCRNAELHGDIAAQLTSTPIQRTCFRSPVITREDRRLATEHQLFMNKKTSVFSWIATLTVGTGVPVYGQSERSKTQESIDRFNAQLRLDASKTRSKAIPRGLSK